MLLVVLGELVQTTAGKWIIHPPTRCPNGHTTVAALGGVHLTHRLVDAASVTQGQGGDGPGLPAPSPTNGQSKGAHRDSPTSWMEEVDSTASATRPNELDLLAILAAAGLPFTSVSEQIDHAEPRDAAAEAGLRLLDLSAEHALGL